jgi:hypothetical protein
MANELSQHLDRYSGAAGDGRNFGADEIGADAAD